MCVLLFLLEIDDIVRSKISIVITEDFKLVGMSSLPLLSFTFFNYVSITKLVPYGEILVDHKPFYFMQPQLFTELICIP